MIKMMRWLAGAALAATLAACGGGGGSPGTTPGNPPTGGTTTVATPTLALDIVDSTGAVTTTVSNTATVYARATAKDKDGNPMAQQVVTFTADSSLARFVPANGSALTDSSGVAKVQIAPASETSAGAGTLSASATLAGAQVSKNYTFQVPQGQSSDQQTAKVTNYIVLLDKTTLANAGTATANLSIVALDADNNVVPNAVVQVTTNANTFFTPNGTKTGSNGVFTGTISNGNDKTDRTVTITSKINNITKQTTIQITGSKITLTATPSVLTPGSPATVTARLTDSSNSPIAGTTLLFSGDFAGLTGQTGVTDSNGNVTKTVTAPSTPGTYGVSVAGSGVTSQISVQVGSSAVIPNAVIPAGAAPSLAVVPNVVAPNASGSTANQAQVKFLFLDGNNLPVPNVRVRFQITSTGLGSLDSTINTGTATVYTNAAGIATAAFIPGETTSPTDGVTVRACWQATNFTSTTQCDNWVDAKLTVTGTALAVSIGDDNELTKGSGTYIKKFTVTVADAVGRAVANAPVEISLDLTHYGKGTFLNPYRDAGGAQTFPPTGLTVVPSDPFTSYPSDTTDPATRSERVWCYNEDRNRNGFVDSGENRNGSIDTSGQPTLEPRRSDMVISYADPNVRTTDASGILVIQVQYSQRFGTWLAYRVRATTSVSGSQGTAERLFVTDIAEDDVENGSFLTPPYGVGTCQQSN